MVMAAAARPADRAIAGGASPHPTEDGIEAQAVWAAAQWMVDDKHVSPGVGTQVYDVRGDGSVFIGINYVGGGTAPTSKIGTKWRGGRWDGLSWRNASNG